MPKLTESFSPITKPTNLITPIPIHGNPSPIQTNNSLEIENTQNIFQNQILHQN